MLSVGLCLLAFMFSYAAGRRSLSAGLATVFTVGYFYGILRANIPEPFSHFIFDAGVVGLYLTPPDKAVVVCVDEKSRAPRGAGIRAGGGARRRSSQ